MNDPYRSDINNAVRVLRAGGVILYPTDTVWGLGCDATNQSAVRKIYGIKKRADNKSLIILVNSVDMLSRYVAELPEVALELADISLTPLTIVYDRGRNLAPGVAASDGSVGVRICRDEFCDELISQLRRPLVSTSANTSGNVTPAIFDDITDEIMAATDYVCMHRRDDLTRANASSVIKVSANGVVKILRG